MVHFGLQLIVELIVEF